MSINYVNVRGHGSVANAMMQHTGIVPEVGMGATILMHTDRYAATIVKINSPKSIVIQQDNAIRSDKNGMSENQSYEYSPNVNSEKRTFTLRKNGRWVESGSGTMWNGTKLSIGIRKEYYDFNF